MFGISVETWNGAIIGAVLGSIVIPIVLLVFKTLATWWRDNPLDQESGNSIPRDTGYGYGVILKCRNPLKMSGRPGVAFLVSGFGTLGTGAAAYYLRENYRSLGR